MTSEAVASYIEKTGFWYVSIYEGARASKPSFCTADFSEGKDLTPAEAAKIFLDFMDDMPDGKYVARLKPGITKGSQERELTFTKAKDHTPAIGAASAGSADINRLVKEMEGRFEAKLEAYKVEQEKQRLLSEIEDLKNQVESARGWESKLDFGVNMLIKKMFEDQDRPETKPSVSGLNGNGHSSSYEHAQEATDINNRFSEAAGVLADKLGIRTVNFMEKLAKIPADKLEKLNQMDDNTLSSLLAML